jgi:DNA-binding NarL/FixJ family response regulator
MQPCPQMTRNPRKLRILVADDHELVRRGIRGLLCARRGWRVVGEATDGREAVEKASKLKPDVAILDISMPDLDGLQATRQIRGAAPATEVVVLTMHESDQMVRRVLDAGALGYVLKSDLAAHLVKAVKDVSVGKLFLTPRVSDIVLKGFLKTGKQSDRPGRVQAQPTPREIEIIRLLAEGKANKRIAAELGITIRTVETHRAKIMLKLGLHSLTELIHYAIRHEIFSAPGASDELSYQT